MSHAGATTRHTGHEDATRVAHRTTSRRPAGMHTTPTAHLGPDNDTVATSTLHQFAIVIAATIVIMLLVLWRRR